MWIVGPLGFTAPLVLLALVVLPVLWLLLRAVPPAPIRRRFPGVALLLGLTDDEVETDKTPWWLLLLRAAAIAAAIVAFAGPVLNPQPRDGGSGPLLVLLDGGWADARDWPRRLERAEALVEEAGRDGRTVAVLRLTDAPQVPAFQAGDAVAGTVAGTLPQAWAPGDMAGWAGALPEGDFDSFWLSDGLDHPGRDALLAALEARGAVRVYESPRAVLALKPAVFDEGVVKLSALRLPAAGAQEAEVSARGPDPAGVERELARATLAFADGAGEAMADLNLPPELRNRVTRFEIAGVRSAGAVSLTDDSLKRRKVALIGGEADAEGLLLLSPTHYLEQALAPLADLIDGSLADILLANPDVIVLADVAQLSPAEQDGILDWLDGGGLLLRFAGPRLAAADHTGDDPLMPVRLRAGGRAIGGAMSWGEAKALAPFAEGSPFFGLPVPPDVTVTEQVLAEPDPELGARTIAALADGTPLVTRRAVGEGQVVLFHVTANAEWSTLPLSGLFVSMLERLAVSTRPAVPEAADLAGQVWTPEVVLDAFGVPGGADDLPGVEGAVLAAAVPGPELRPGLYAGEDRRVALNVIRAETVLAAAAWPARIAVEGLEAATERALKGPVLGGALVLLLIDVLAALSISGRLRGRSAGMAALVMAALLLPAPGARAQEAVAPPDPAADAFAVEATSAVRLGYIQTDDPSVNAVAKAGLAGLGYRLFERTTIEPLDPMAIDLEADELAFFPFLYWPVTATQPIPSAAAYAKLNQYLRTGGMILFDTRDGGVPGAQAGSPEARRLQLIAAPLDIPPLEPVPADHVLTRTFYLIQDFPGRYQGQLPWVEAAPPDAAQAEGMPFRNLNDGVTPVVIGGNDWAAAWAVDERGAPEFPVGRGSGGERQREMAYRFGINLIMHVLTGNYKSDQVHVPALLERLGQ